MLKVVNFYFLTWRLNAERFETLVERLRTVSHNVYSFRTDGLQVCQVGIFCCLAISTVSLFFLYITNEKQYDKRKGGLCND